ncbi:MAG: hypothetical protein J6V39_06625, partial [Clostridia bacterium]|nr:hypothetical protein [Clostridia bacterium]
FIDSCCRRWRSLIAPTAVFIWVLLNKTHNIVTCRGENFGIAEICDRQPPTATIYKSNQGLHQNDTVLNFCSYLPLIPQPMGLLFCYALPAKITVTDHRDRPPCIILPAFTYITTGVVHAKVFTTTLSYDIIVVETKFPTILHKRMDINEKSKNSDGICGICHCGKHALRIGGGG